VPQISTAKKQDDSERVAGLIKSVKEGFKSYIARDAIVLDRVCKSL
jgi:hypothetical protein